MTTMVVLKSISELPQQALVSASPFFTEEEVKAWGVKNKAEIVWAYQHQGSKMVYLTAWYNPKLRVETEVEK